MNNKFYEDQNIKIAAVYIRVSTKDQAEYSPDAQLKAIREYALKHNILIRDDLIFRDEGMSGRNAKTRPAFMEMIRMAKSKERIFDLILVHKFSRFARSREDSIIYKSMLRKEHGIDVISITEPITEDKFSLVIEAMHEALDEYYSINLSSEVIKGMKEKASRGEIQTAPPYGYSKDPGKPLKIIEEEARIIRMIFDWYLNGESFFSIAGKLNLMGARTKRGNLFESRGVEYILNNPVYKGYSRWSPNKTLSLRIFDSPETLVVKSNHEPIIPEALFEKAAKKIKMEKGCRRKSKPVECSKHYLSGLLKCGNCNSSLGYSRANDGFQCVGYSHGSCKISHFISSKKIESAILAQLNSMPNIGYSFVFSDTNLDIDLIKKELNNIEKMMERVKQSYICGIDSINDYRENKALIQSKINAKKAELKKATEKHLDEIQFCSIAELLKSDIPPYIKGRALRSIVEKIVFTRPEERVIIFFYL